MSDKLETCKNCAWWWPNRSIKNKSQSLDPRFSDEIHWDCEHDLLGLNIGADCYPGGASSYESIMTGPDFGCIHWQVKEPF